MVTRGRRNVLSVDWDFFFPSPEGNPANDGATACLFDWGHSEAYSPGLLYVLWVTRAAQLKMAGREFPALDPAWKTFADRHRYVPSTKLWVAESHADIYPLLHHGDRVWNFDAHHDAGYRPIQFDATPRDCSNWVRFARRFRSVETTVIYPAWKTWALAAEPKPRCHLVRLWEYMVDTFPAFDVVFVCRSGSWVPPCYDAQFNAFLETFRCEREQFGVLPPRPWNEADVDNHVQQMQCAFPELTDREAHQL